MTPGIANSSPHWSSCVYSRRRSAVFNRLRHDMPTNGPGPISASRCFHAATRSGSATRNDGRSGKLVERRRGSAAAGCRPGSRSRSRASSRLGDVPARLIVCARTSASGNERREQRRDARIGLDHDVARGRRSGRDSTTRRGSRRRRPARGNRARGRRGARVSSAACSSGARCHAGRAGPTPTRPSLRRSRPR